MGVAVVSPTEGIRELLLLICGIAATVNAQGRYATRLPIGILIGSVILQFRRGAGLQHGEKAWQDRKRYRQGFDSVLG